MCGFEVHVHFDGPITVTLITQPTPCPSGPGAATQAILSIGGSMPGQITVDTTTEAASVGFVDDKGNPTSAPVGAQIAYSSSDPSVATVDPTSGKIMPVKEGTAGISAHLSGALEADGVTPIPDPPVVTVKVGPGPAAGAALVLTV